MKTSDVVITGGALGALAVIGYLGYNYMKAAGESDQSKKEAAAAAAAAAAATQAAAIPGASQKMTVLTGGDVTPAQPQDITQLPCPTGYYKTAALAMNAFIQAHGGKSISGTWRYEFAPDNKECFRIASVLTVAGEVT